MYLFPMVNIQSNLVLIKFIETSGLARLNPFSAIDLIRSNKRSLSFVILVDSRSSSNALNCCHALVQREFRGIY